MSRLGGRRPAWPALESLEPRTLLSALSVDNLVALEGNSGAKDFAFEVTLSEPAAQVVTVHFRTHDGTAVAGDDYLGVTDGLVTIPAGETRGTATVAVTGDSIVEPFETFSVELFNPAGASIGGGLATGAILNDDRTPGALQAWGDNTYAQTNVPAGNNFVAIDAGELHGIALKADGSLTAWGDNAYGQTDFPAGNDFVAIASGYVHSLALRSDGSLAAWGANANQQTDFPAGNDYVAIAAGGAFSVALKSDGSLIAWGDGTYGQLAVSPGNHFVAVAAGSTFALALRSDGSLAGWGSGPPVDSLPSGNDFVAIAAGANHGLALKADGSLIAWGGDNHYGQTNFPTGNDFVEIAARGLNSLAVRADGSIEAWGHNAFGQNAVPSGNVFGAAATGGRFGLAIEKWIIQINLELPGPTPTFTEQGPSVILDNAAIVGPPSGTDFGGGALAVSITAGATADDRLGINNQGTGPGLIGISSSQVTYGGVVIGLWAGGSSGTKPLTINLNANATQEAVQALARNILFSNVSRNPATDARTVRFVVNDGHGAVSPRVSKSIEVQAINDAPRITVPAGQAVDEDATLVFSAATGNAILVADVDAGGGAEQVALDITDGVLALGSTAGLDSVIGNGTSSITLVGTIASLNAALDGLTFSPTANYSGPATLQVAIDDQGRTGSGGPLTDAEAVAVTVRPVNDAPTADDGNAEPEEHQPILITLAAHDVETPPDQWVFTITAGPEHGALGPVVGNQVTYTPADHYHGPDGFTYTVTDSGDPAGTHANPGDLTSNTATVWITVYPVNDVPTAYGQQVHVNKNGSVEISLRGSDVETPESQLRFTLSTPTQGSLTLIGPRLYLYQPVANYEGPDSFTYTVTDNGDPPGSHLNPGDRTSPPATISVTVDPFNVRPTAAPQSAATDEDVPKDITLGGADVETPLDDLVFTITTPPQHGTLGPLVGRQVTYTPTGHYNGPDSFKFTVTDSGDPAGSHSSPGDLASLPATVDITVMPVNDPPVALDQAINVNKGGSVEIVLHASDVETPEADLVFTPSDPVNGSLTLLGPAHYLYQPAPGYMGADSFTFTVTDSGDPAGSHSNPGDLTSGQATVTIQICEVRTLPSGKKITYVDGNNKTVTVALTGPGSATLFFEHAEPCDVTEIQLTDTTEKSALKITTLAGVVTTIGRITVTGALASLTAATTHLTALGVDQTIAALTLGDVDGGGTIRIGGTAAAKTAVTMKFGKVADTSVVCGMPIGSLTAVQWREIDGTPDTISAPRLGTLAIAGNTLKKISGDLGAGLVLTGEGITGTVKALGAATVKGVVAPSTWDISGPVGTVALSGAVGLAGQPWELTGATTLGTLTLGDVADAVVAVSGKVGAVKAVRWLGGSLAGGTVTSIATTGLAATKTALAIPGDFGADVTISGFGLAVTAKALATASIKGAVAPSTWNISGPVGTVTLSGAVGLAGQPWELKSAMTLGTLTLGDVADAVVAVSGKVGAVKAMRWLEGSLAAGTVTSITTTGVAATSTVPGGISGDFGADVTLSYTGTKSSLGTLTVAGWLRGAAISSAGAVGTVTLGGIEDSTLAAGDLVSAYKAISTLTVKGIKDAGSSFINSNVAAWTLGTVSVKGVQTLNAGHNPAGFGVQARTITSYTRDATKYPSKGLPGFIVDHADDYTVELV